LVKLKVNVEFTLQQAMMKGQRGSRGIAPLFLSTSALDRGGWSTPRHGRFTPPGKTRYPSYRRPGRPQGWSGWVQKISPPTGIHSPDRPARSVRAGHLSFIAAFI